MKRLALCLPGMGHVPMYTCAKSSNRMYRLIAIGDVDTSALPSIASPDLQKQPSWISGE